MCSYLKLNITGIAVIAVCLAIIIVLFGGNNKDRAEKENKKSGTSDNLTEGEIDFE